LLDPPTSSVSRPQRAVHCPHHRQSGRSGRSYRRWRPDDILSRPIGPGLHDDAIFDALACRRARANWGLDAAALLLLQLFFLVAFLSVCVVAVPNAIVQISLTNTPTTAAMTTNVTHFMLDLGGAFVGRDRAEAARARGRAMHTFPVIVGFTIGCVLGAAFESVADLWSLALPAGLALLAFAMGLADRGRAS
jgi:hypothetical protein